MRLLYLNLILLFGSYICHSQKEDFIWMMGYNFIPDTTQDTHGVFNFNFNYDPPIIEKFKAHNFLFNRTGACISDENGKLQVYSNGMQIFGNDHKPIIGGDTINYGDYWNLCDLGEQKYGFLTSQPILFIHNLQRDKILYASSYRSVGDVDTKMMLGIINMSFQKPELILKDSIIRNYSTNTGGVKFIKHGNGRDYWLTFTDGDHNFIFVYYLDLSTGKIQLIHEIPINLNYTFTTGQVAFSEDGKYYGIFQNENVDHAKGHFSLFKFNRCSGEFEKIFYKKYKSKNITKGLAFSLDNTKLYTCDLDWVWQYDLLNEDILPSEKIVAVNDGFINDDPGFAYKLNFGFMNLAPDGKIYITSGNMPYFHRIEYPDEEGEDCKVNQHVLKTLYNASTIPNFTNFRLGPEDGSECDTLGLDNHSVAKFRYEQDTTNHLNVRFTDLSYFSPETWHWDFDDGTTFDGKKPYWHEFPRNGTYNVCLTVSNENSEHTMCRQVTIGSTSTLNLPPSTLNYVSLFPNPTEGEVLLTLSDYIPEHGEVYFYDMMGKEVYKQRVYYGWNSVNLNHLCNGQYIYQVFDRKNKISHGKLIKI